LTPRPRGGKTPGMGKGRFWLDIRMGCDCDAEPVAGRCPGCGCQVVRFAQTLGADEEE